MAEPVASTRRKLVRREDLLFGIVVALFVTSVVLLGSLLLITQLFEPDGVLGRPGQILTCGRTYRADPGLQRSWTLAEVKAATAPGFEPRVFELVLGEIPLFAPLVGGRDVGGVSVCDTLVWLHVGPDAYVGYALEGGP